MVCWVKEEARSCLVHRLIYLLGKVVRLVCHPEISQTTALHATLLVSLECSWRVGCTDLVWLGLRLFGATMWKLLIIEPFSWWKLDKIEIEKCIRIWGHSWCFWKALGESNSIEFISQFSELRCRRYCFLSGFFCWKFKQITKIRFGRKNQLSPQCVHTWANGTG
jgi:hypothetical protein